MELNDGTRTCGEGTFRIVGGRRVWIDPSESVYQRLKLDEAFDAGAWRAKREGQSRGTSVVA